MNKDNARPALVTFEPVAGLGSYQWGDKYVSNYKSITYGRLEKRLVEMIHILRPGGYIYLERPFQMEGLAEFFQSKSQKDYDISIHLKKIARQQKCTIEISSCIGGPYFLLNKSFKAKC